MTKKKKLNFPIDGLSSVKLIIDTILIFNTGYLPRRRCYAAQSAPLVNKTESGTDNVFSKFGSTLI